MSATFGKIGGGGGKEGRGEKGEKIDEGRSEE